jgi:MarR family transcriptional regulator, transcriptional regulator for hemolysin
MSFQSNLDFALHETSRLFCKRFEQKARGLGLAPAQWYALIHLAHNEGIHQAGLAEILEIGPIALIRILDKLEGRGLVERQRHAHDRRIWLLFLTPQAHSILSVMRDAGEETLAEALAGIPDGDRTRLLDSLTQIKVNLLVACSVPVDQK